MNPALFGDMQRLSPGTFAQMTNYLGGWKWFVKVNDLRACLTAASAWVFADESMYTLNDGYMQPLMPMPGYPDIPGKYDCNGNCFSYVDGHTEYRKWQWNTGNANAGILNVPYGYNRRAVPEGKDPWGSSGFDVDWLWLREHTSCPPGS